LNPIAKSEPCKFNMKRSEINALVAAAGACFSAHGWALPPRPRWDITDFGLGDWRRFGLVLVNLCEEPEYCEKLMYARQGMTTPWHTHARKKEDIICRWGRLGLRVSKNADGRRDEKITVSIDQEPREVQGTDLIELAAGSRVTLLAGIYHEFSPLSSECIIGEVSTANNDVNDNFFVDPAVGRFAQIEEDEPSAVRLVSDKP
jgi:D-lyxose ketol-isomerase